MRTRIAAAAAATALLLPGAALAHTGVGEAAGFAAGFIHPLGGADHLATMVVVGLWAGLLGDVLRLRLPAAFLGGMALGAVLGAVGVGVPSVEAGVLASVVLAGALVATAARLPQGLALILAGAFGALHGYAHGAEMTPGADALGYGAGFLVATAMLLGLGLQLAHLADRSALRLAARLAGGAACLAAGVVAGTG